MMLLRSMLSVLILAAAALRASPPVVLPPVAYADTETTTNVVLAAWDVESRRFLFSIACIATPSNNLEVAFGTDSNGDGRLDHHETGLVAGWDCGAWFVRRGLGLPVFEPSDSTNSVQSLDWKLHVNASATPTRLTVSANGQPVFAALASSPPDWLFDSHWNLMRLTGRGLGVSGERFTVQQLPDALSIHFK